jgi:hypothetical protein
VDVVYPAKNRPPRHPVLTALLWALVGAALAAGGFAAWKLWPRPSTRRQLEELQHRTKLDELNRQMMNYSDAMYLAEELGDRKAYAENARQGAQKLIEADAEWNRLQELQGDQKGMMLGLRHGVTEEPIHKFTEKEKFQMISEAHGLTEETARAVKAEIEMMFADEFAEKFATDPQAAAEEEVDKPSGG